MQAEARGFEPSLDHLNFQGPVVQSIVSVVSSLVVKTLIILVSTISNSQVFFFSFSFFFFFFFFFFFEKNVSSICYSHQFFKIICIYAIFHDQSFNDTLSNCSHSADPDQTPQNAASDQGHHCLQIV